jgi:Xaa-Pro dipeptidase
MDYSTRQNRLMERIQVDGLEALVVNPGPSLKYLTGLSFHLMERPVVVIFTPQSHPVIILPGLEAAKTSDLPYPITAFTYGEDPSSWNAVFSQAAEASGLSASRLVGVEPRSLRVLELRFLEEAAPQAEFIAAEETIASLRIFKDSNELDSMRKAVDIAQQALLATLPIIKAGVTEKQIAAELTVQLLRSGSDPELAFSPIVSGGPNAANPHASPSNRKLQPGDLLVIDWGATYNGYISDITRTFAIGQPDAEMSRIARIVAEANIAARTAAGPEVTAAEVDASARRVVEQAGYGQFFIHRTGHGIGMEGHEAPYIRPGNESPLHPGMTFTIEPGIYLPNRNGVRIEDNVVITATGIECLTSLPRELHILG